MWPSIVSRHGTLYRRMCSANAARPPKKQASMCAVGTRSPNRRGSGVAQSRLAETAPSATPLLSPSFVLGQRALGGEVGSPSPQWRPCWAQGHHLAPLASSVAAELSSSPLWVLRLSAGGFLI
jgi:hypothetical protein